MRHIALLCATALASLIIIFPGHAQITAFTYQGVLKEAGLPANGSNDFTFTLYATAVGSGLMMPSNVVNDVVVSNGLFTVTLDFGSTMFNGSDRWLEIAVRPGDSTGAYTNLTPRQRITSVPYAIYAQSSSNAVFATTSLNFSGLVGAGGLSGVYSNAVTLTNGANAFRGTFTGNGTAVTNVNAARLNGQTAAEFWQIAGNTVSPSHVLGSVNNQEVTFVVNGFTALRLVPNSMASPSLIGGNGNSIFPDVSASVVGGGFANEIQTNANQSVIAGGSFAKIGQGSGNCLIGAGNNNAIQTNCYAAAIVSGEANTIGTNSFYSFIGSGLQNELQGNTTYSFIGGGNVNAILPAGTYSFIGSGLRNTNGATTSVIAGGQGNTVQSFADRSFIGGGSQNNVTGAFGMVPGGFANSAAGQCFAAGRRAKANNSGSFVWADSTDADLATTGVNQVRMRASGGYALFSNAGLTTGVTLAGGTSAWGTVCDRNAKKNFTEVDSQEILEKLADIPVQWWNYKSEDDDAVPNLGPMAQDFKATFYPGRDDKVITTLEFDGVELAAIKGLNQKLEARSQELENRSRKLEAQNAELKEKNESLEKRLAALEKIVLSQKAN